VATVKDLIEQINHVQAAFDASPYHDADVHVNIEPGDDEGVFRIIELNGEGRIFVATLQDSTIVIRGWANQGGYSITLEGLKVS